jgi:ribonuclease HI
MTDKVTIYSDGGSDPNPGYGGWAAILQYGEHEKVLTGNDLNATNNRMELQAAISALKMLKRPCSIEFYTDSQYVRRGITEWIDGWVEKGWKKGGKSILNADLWKQLLPLTKQHQIEWHWVRGHAGNEMNERVDVLAREARLAITPKASTDPNAPRLYVRSSCRGNPGPGGWGVVLDSVGETEQISGSEPNTTNNRMELMAALEGLRLVNAGTFVQLFTTSDYLYQGATNWINGWRKRQWQKRGGSPIANADLWQLLDKRMKEYDVHWFNAKGEIDAKHALPLEEAGKLAQNAALIV